MARSLKAERGFVLNRRGYADSRSSGRAAGGRSRCPHLLLVLSPWTSRNAIAFHSPFRLGLGQAL
jgi:hypothetical protein